MADRPPLPREEVQRILARLSPLAVDGRIVLIGGQAVAWWTYFLGLGATGGDVEIFTSEDIDFEGATRSARVAAELLDGEVRVPEIDHHTPNTGQVLFTDSDGFRREIDFLGSPMGLDATDVRASAVPMSVPDDQGDEASVLVMHPERCMESRVHNVVGLGTTGEIAMTQLRRSIACAREWSRYLLDDKSIGERTRVRAVLNLNMRSSRSRPCCSTSGCRRGSSSVGTRKWRNRSRTPGSALSEMRAAGSASAGRPHAHATRCAHRLVPDWYPPGLGPAPAQIG